jgi:hypothetical protein
MKLKTNYYQSLSPSAHNASDMAKKMIKKIRCNFAKLLTTVQQLHSTLDVNVARIVRAKHICLLRSFNRLVNCSFSGRSNRRGEIFKATGLSIFYVQKFASNSHLFLFHRAQKPVQYQGFARNWDSTGYFEVIHQACK